MSKTLAYLNEIKFMAGTWKPLVEWESERGGCGVYESEVQTGFAAENVYMIIRDANDTIAWSIHYRATISAVIHDCAVIASFAGASRVEQSVE